MKLKHGKNLKEVAEATPELFVFIEHIWFTSSVKPDTDGYYSGDAENTTRNFDEHTYCGGTDHRAS